MQGVSREQVLERRAKDEDGQPAGADGENAGEEGIEGRAELRFF